MREESESLSRTVSFAAARQQPQRQPSLDVVARFASHNLCGKYATNPADLNLAAEGRKSSTPPATPNSTSPRDCPLLVGCHRGVLNARELLRKKESRGEPGFPYLEAC
jgi:hypothetical protein